MFIHPAACLPCWAASGGKGEKGLPPHHLVQLLQPNPQGRWFKQESNPHPITSVPREQGNKDC